MRIKPIEIKDLSLLTIKKVKPWSIIVTYDDKEYLIHGGSELGEGDWQDLYERKVDKYGHYELKPLGCKPYASEFVDTDCIRISINSKKKYPHRPIVYRDIDKEFFAYKLTKNGFATGIMVDKLVENQKIKKEKEKQIRELEEKITALRREIKDM